MSNLIKHRKDIDGLRAIAVLSVIIFHLEPTILLGGFVGVDIFFIISGFLITKILLRELENRQFSFSAFYIRRIRRIFPALFLVLFSTSFFAVLILGTVDLMWFCKTLKYSAFQISNFLFQKKVGYFDTQFNITPLLHTWSLAVEEQFYLVFPLLLHFLFRLRKSKDFIFYILVFLSLSSLIFSQLILADFQKIAFFSLPSRFWELGLGGLLAFDKVKMPSKSKKEILGIFGLTLIGIAIFCTDKNNFPGIYALPACIGASLVIFSGQNGETIAAKFLGNRLFIFLGAISYSLYLWHYPIIEFYKELAGVDKISQIAAALIFSAAVVMAYLSYKYVEIPFRKKKNLFAEKRVNFLKYKIYLPFLVSFICIAFFCLAATVIKAGQDQKHKGIFGDNSREKKNAFNGECLLEGEVDFSENFIEKCAKGENKKEFEVLLIGDSHAWRYSDGLFKWAQKKNYSMAVIASTSCPSFIDNGTVFCGNFLEMINQKIQENKNLKYIFLANKWSDDVADKEVFEQGMSKIIKNFSKQDRQVVIMGLVPIFNFDPVKCISKNHALIYQILPFLTKSDCQKELKTEVMPSNEFLTKTFFEMVEKYGAKYFDPKKYLCDQEYCYSEIEGKILYSDPNHLDYEGSAYVAKYFDF